jgi:hypothetical protein
MQRDVIELIKDFDHFKMTIFDVKYAQFRQI